VRNRKARKRETMNHYRIPRRAKTLLLAAVGAILAGCASPPGGSRDHLVGWFDVLERDENKKVIPGQGRLIPVFKRSGAYYSVCRGFECPLKECPEGLAWAVTPSSMTGTKIGWDAASKTAYLAVLDSQASNFTDGRYGVGEKQPLTRVEKPSGLLDAKASRPRSRDDFLGWFQPIWLPWVKIGVRKDGDRYVSQDRVFHGPEPGSWKTSAETHELTPLPDQLGFTGFERGGGPRIVYNGALKRFELVMSDSKRSTPEIRMPLARVPAPASPEREGSPAPAARIGIPAWH
jgi:hypothetical protein